MGAARVLAAVLLVAAGACSGNDAPSADFIAPTTPNRPPWQVALIHGRLAVHKGCLGVETDDGEFVLVLWAGGTELRGEVLAGSTGAMIGVGDAIQVGGREGVGDEREVNPDLAACMDAMPGVRVFTGGPPLLVDGPLL